MIRSLAKYFRQNAPERWAGLPNERGRQPSRIGANLFVLGCAVDFRRDANSAWDAAQRFLFGVVPFTRRDTVWEWIAGEHTLAQWNRKIGSYGLHRYPAGHMRVYRIAKALVTLFNGDPRKLWSRPPEDIEPIDYVGSVLHAVRFGPELSHMLIGALRDHGLLHGPSHFKADVHVCRGMHVLGLSPSRKPSDVLAAGKRYFKDSWEVDLAFFRLGRLELNTQAQIRRFYLEKIRKADGRNGTRTWRAWLPHLVEIAKNHVPRTLSGLSGGNWRLRRRLDSGPDGRDYGFSLHPTRGKLKQHFDCGDLGAWTGFAYDAANEGLSLWTEIWFSSDLMSSSNLPFRQALYRTGFRFSTYADRARWEAHDKRLTSFLRVPSRSLLQERLASKIRRAAREAIQLFERLE